MQSFIRRRFEVLAMNIQKLIASIYFQNLYSKAWMSLANVLYYWRETLYLAPRGTYRLCMFNAWGKSWS
jgi:hypothetical protein